MSVLEVHDCVFVFCVDITRSGEGKEGIRASYYQSEARASSKDKGRGRDTAV